MYAVSSKLLSSILPIIHDQSQFDSKIIEAKAKPRCIVEKKALKENEQEIKFTHTDLNTKVLLYVRMKTNTTNSILLQHMVTPNTTLTTSSAINKFKL
jgi:hypothetical protein